MTADRTTAAGTGKGAEGGYVWRRRGGLPVGTAEGERAYDRWIDGPDGPFDDRGGLSALKIRAAFAVPLMGPRQAGGRRKKERGRSAC